MSAADAGIRSAVQAPGKDTVSGGLWLWPAVAIIAVYWSFHFAFQAMEVTPLVRFLTRMAAHALLLLAMLIWWGLNRQIPFRHRLVALAVAVAGGVAAAFAVHPTLGIIGVLTTGISYVATAWVFALALLRKATPAARWTGWGIAVLAAWGALCLLRMDGLSGEQMAALRWRWDPTAEERFLADRKGLVRSDMPAAMPPDAAPLEALPGDWVAFRGSDRSGAAPGSEIAGDFGKYPPKLLWRQRVGPSWSALIVVGGRLFTQEQRGDQEVVACYDAATGRELWIHSDDVRFWDQVSGAGPRATPTFADGRVFTLGGTGLLNCLDAATGKRHWSHDVAREAESQRPMWGVSSSPLVVGARTIVFAGGDKQRSLLAYNAQSGKQEWSLDAGPGSYSSPQLVTLCGRQQILVLSDAGLFAADPTSGKMLWSYPIQAPGAPISIQPHVAGDDQVLVASAVAGGVAMLRVKSAGDDWKVEEEWVSLDLKPSFNDLVIVGHHAYGFDNSLFACIDLASGKRTWKKGRYGNGQVIALPERDELLVLAESGQVVLLAADPARHRELGKFQAITGKTWNHPVLCHGRLYVRNAEEMACYDVSGPAEAQRSAE